MSRRHRQALGTSALPEKGYAKRILVWERRLLACRARQLAEHVQQVSRKNRSSSGRETLQLRPPRARLSVLGRRRGWHRHKRSPLHGRGLSEGHVRHITRQTFQRKLFP